MPQPAPSVKYGRLTCPECRATHWAEMPAHACQWRVVCPACGAVLTPRPGDCCVFCSYGDVPCEASARAAQAHPRPRATGDDSAAA